MYAIEQTCIQPARMLNFSDALGLAASADLSRRVR
jgi:hypothetical protein